MRGKVLGQHFLVNKHKLQKIVEALDLKSGDTVIEIGPGHGELTDELRIMNYELRIIVIEKDEEFVRHLQNKFAQDKNVKIVKGDALKILPKIINSILGTSDVPNIRNFRTSDVQKLKIVGNIPYYITGYLLRILGESERKPSLIVLTIQKEVAQRITAQPPRMNLLAASVQFWAEPEIIDYISKTDFQPQPKVDSAIIKLKSITVAMRPHRKCYKEEETEEYYKLIKILFKQPRKTILNNLLEADKRGSKQNYYRLIKTLFKQPRKTILNNLRDPKLRIHPNAPNNNDVNIWRSDLQKLLTKIGINPQDRPQNLTIEQIKKIIGGAPALLARLSAKVLTKAENSAEAKVRTE